MMPTVQMIDYIIKIHESNHLHSLPSFISLLNAYKLKKKNTWQALGVYIHAIVPN